MIPPLSLVGASLPTYSTNPALTPNNKNKVSGSSASNQRQGYSGEEIRILGEKIRNSETSVADLIQTALKIFVYLRHMSEADFPSSAQSRSHTRVLIMSEYPKLTSWSRMDILIALIQFGSDRYERCTSLSKKKRESELKLLISERVSELTGLLQELQVRLERTHSTALSPELTELLQDLRVRSKGTHSKARLRKWTVLLQKLWVRLGKLMPTTH